MKINQRANFMKLNYKKEKRLYLIVFFLTCVNSISLIAQTSFDEIGLKNGAYQVGFRHYVVPDSTRTYQRSFDYTNAHIARPIRVSIWYPSIKKEVTAKPMAILDYFKILSKEEEWEHLPDEQLLNWFYYRNTDENQGHLKEKTKAYRDLESIEGKFPIVVYTPSYQASSIENFALCEYLASHGFIVISSPSRGADHRWFSKNNAKEMETQARDTEFLIKEGGTLSIANTSEIALLGFSFGGLSNIIVQSRNARVKALISLDGTERYQYGQLAESPFFDVHKLNVPYAHLAQKDIPQRVLKADRMNPELNFKFQLYDSLSNSSAHSLKFHHLTHSYFSSLGVLFSDRDRRQDKSDQEILASYRLVCIYVLNFLEATLKDNVTALEILQNPNDKIFPSDLVTHRSKKATERMITFNDFNDRASQQDYQNLWQLYTSIKAEHPDFRIPEGSLNTLGLQLVFNPTTSSKGIKVFKLAIKLYPNSSNLFDSLAEGYLFLGNNELAKLNFEKSLELNEQNQNAKRRLEQLSE